MPLVIPHPKDRTIPTASSYRDDGICIALAWYGVPDRIEVNYRRFSDRRQTSLTSEIQIWNVQRRVKQLSWIPSKLKRISHLAYSHSGKALISATSKAVSIWESTTGALLHHLICAPTDWHRFECTSQPRLPFFVVAECRWPSEVTIKLFSVMTAKLLFRYDGIRIEDPFRYDLL